MIFKKRRLSDSQIEKFNQLGKRFGGMIYNSRLARKIYFSIHRFGNRYPAIIVVFFMSLCTLTIGISFYRTFDSSYSEYIPVEVPKDYILQSRYDDSIRIAQEGIEKIFIDAKAISDSIQAILNKPELSLDDSVYVVTKGEYLKRLTEIVQNKQ